MKWVALESSAISALGYDPRRRRLGIEFHDKRQVYFYYDVPCSEFEAFLSAESKGRYLTQIFLARQYRFTGPHPSRRRAA